MRKILLAAHHLGLRDYITLEVADTSDPSDSLREQNPTGGIPVLVKQDGSSVYDSRVIMDFLDFEKPIVELERKIEELKIKLPEAKPPVGSYVATKITGNLLFISGQISIAENGDLIKGKIGKDLSTEQGYDAAKRCGLSIVSQAKVACDGDLSKIKSCIKLTGYVNSTDNYTDQPKVINGASDLIASIFGDAGMHTRAAVSTNSLPLGVSVEVDAIFELN